MMPMRPVLSLRRVSAREACAIAAHTIWISLLSSYKCWRGRGRLQLTITLRKPLPHQPIAALILRLDIRRPLS
jgi:hypothetical protein